MESVYQHSRNKIGISASSTERQIWSIHVVVTMRVGKKRTRDGAVVRALASHQCGPGSIPRLGVIYGLSLLVLYSEPRGFLRVLRFSPLLKNQNLI